MSEDTFQSQWLEYLKALELPRGVDPVQVAETRRAFYAGAIAAVTLFVEVTDERQMVRIMSRLAGELRRFSEDVRAGRA